MFVRALYENARMCPVKRGSKNRAKHNLPNHKQRLIHVSQYKMLCANLKKTAGKIKKNEAGKQACRKAILLLFAEREGVRACARARADARVCVCMSACVYSFSSTIEEHTCTRLSEL